MSIKHVYISAIANKENTDVELVRNWALMLLMNIEVQTEWKRTSDFFKGFMCPPISAETLDYIDNEILHNETDVIEAESLLYIFEKAEQECNKYVEYIHDIQNIINKYQNL
ncbi:MAG: hypothetical protein RSE50_12260 [Myroides sp.]|uniref:hypothetical protein n=1 Tax=Acinetobacter sp. MF4642 TaxID=1960825 RepID=UPI000994CFDD|nr:hypothetical protein [Acinetobacter sp. MF4642]OOW11568.1 hypothetical protein MF4642_03760 [Acinetobacter sp. MF4642]